MCCPTVQPCTPRWSRGGDGRRCAGAAPRAGRRAARTARGQGACLEKQLQKFLMMIVWRLVGLNLHCKCF